MSTTLSRIFRRCFRWFAAVVLGGLAVGCGGHDGHEMDHGDATLAAPTELTASALGGGVHLTWRDNSTGEDEFMVVRMPAGGEWAAVGATDAEATTFHDSTVESGTTYTYFVHAMSGSAESAPSNEVTIDVP